MDRFVSRFSVEYPTDLSCRVYGELAAEARKEGFTVPEGDGWHAATALALGVPLVTHNARNYQGIPGLVVITEPDR